MLSSAPAPTFTDCAWHVSPVHTGWPTFIANYFANDSAYDSFDGVSYTSTKVDPENTYFDSYTEDERTHVNHNRRFNLPQLPMSQQLLFQSICIKEEMDSSAWHIQKVGPFETTGGNSWIQLSGRNIGNFDTILRTQGVLYLVANMMGGVDSYSKPVSYPPLHIHHSHITFSGGHPPLDQAMPSMLLYNLPKTTLAERHASDFLCDEEGIQCHTEEEPGHYGRAFHQPLDFDAEINDVRPALSTSMQWSYQVALRYKSGGRTDGTRSISYLQIGIGGPAGRGEESHQLMFGRYCWLAMHTKYVSFTQSLIPEKISGAKLVYARQHHHVNLLHKAFLCTSNNPFTACGINATMFWHSVIPFCTRSAVLYLSHTPYNSFEALELRINSSEVQCTTTRRQAKDIRPSSICHKHIVLSRRYMQSLAFLEYPKQPEAPTFQKRLIGLHAAWLIGVDPSLSMSCYNWGGYCSPPQSSFHVLESVHSYAPLFPILTIAVYAYMHRQHMHKLV